MGKIKKVCIVGAGGFGRETFIWLQAASGNDSSVFSKTVVFLESEVYSDDMDIMGAPVILSNEFEPLNYKTVVAINDPSTRERVVLSLPKQTIYTSVIHPSSVFSKWVSVGQGAIIGSHVSLTCNIIIGDHANINPNSTIAHDCTIGNFFTASPATNISGNCKIGDRVYCGSNSSIKQGLSVCNDVIIGMGANVIKSICEPGVYFGNPARKIRSISEND